MWPRIVILLLSLLLHTRGWAAQDFLEPEKAFRLSSRVADATTVELAFDVAPGYYLYREPFRFEARQATLGAPAIPGGKIKYDENFQKDVETYRDSVVIRLPVTQAGPSFDLAVTSQGCADAGLCYPPMTQTLKVSLAGYGGDGTVRAAAGGDSPLAAALSGPSSRAAPSAGVINTDSPTDGQRIDAVLRSGHFWSVVGVFAAAGLLLSFTPCVLPMVPILASIIVGHAGTTSRRRGLLLAGSYSLGMALVYTVFGVAAGLVGEGLAAALQIPWVLALFALLLGVLALSMFGVYTLQLPEGLRHGMTRAADRLRGGRLAGVFVMGGVSALIVSPCVAAPLAGALVYLSQTRDVVLGGSALFALAAGMSVPLLLVGASAASLLPRVGAWMESVKRAFGFVLLGVAVWIVQPVLARPLALGLWGALALATAIWLGLGRRNLWQRGAAAFFGALGLMQVIGAATGGGDPLRPLAHLAGRAEGTSLVTFTRVKTIAELDAALAAAGPPVMLDFYADWCVSCKEMEHFTFSEPEVRERLSKARLLQVDVTQNNADDRALMRRFGLFGPPGTLFFDAQGREIAALRVVGYQDAARFKQTLTAAGL